jgi:hypothetical protein
LDLEGIHLILHQVHVAPSPSSSNLVSNSGMCDTVTTNADRVPQWTLLAATTLTRPSSSFTTVESDAAKEDDPSSPSSTKSRTRAAEVHRASSSMSPSHHVVYSAPSRSTASSSQSASWARPDGGPRIRLQTLTPGLSRRERRSSCLQNSTINSSTISTLKVSFGEHPSMNSTAEDIAAKSVASSPVILA